MSSQSLKQINSLFQQLQSNISTLNKAKAQISAKQKTKQFAVPKKDKRKILKLFQHSSWQHFIKWVNDKLLESGQNQFSQFNIQEKTQERKSFERGTEPLEESLDFQLSQQFKQSQKQSAKMETTKKGKKQTAKKEEITQKDEEELQLLALENGRLRRENIILKNKLIQIRTSLPE